MKLRLMHRPSRLYQEAEVIFNDASFYFEKNDSPLRKAARLAIGSIVLLARISSRKEIGSLLFLSDFIAETVGKNGEKQLFFETREEVDTAIFEFSKERGIKDVWRRVSRILTLLPSRYFPEEDPEPLLDFVNDVLGLMYDKNSPE